MHTYQVILTFRIEDQDGEPGSFLRIDSRIRADSAGKAVRISIARLRAELAKPDVDDDGTEMDVDDEAIEIDGVAIGAIDGEVLDEPQWEKIPEDTDAEAAPTQTEA